MISLKRPDSSAHGLERSAWEYAKQLTAHGSEVTIIYSFASKNRTEEVVSGMNLIGLPRNGVLGYLRFSVACRDEVIRQDPGSRFDIIALFGHKGVLAGALLRNHANQAIVWHIATSSVMEMRGYFSDLVVSLPGSLPRLYAHFEGIVLELLFARFVDAIVTGTPRSRAETAYLGKEAFAVPYGQGASDFIDASTRETVDAVRSRFAGKKIVLFVGEGWHRKGVRFLLRAFSEVRQRVPAVLLVVSSPQRGYGHLMRELDLKLGRSVIVTGFVSDKTLGVLYSACDVFVLPSHHEVLSQTLLEAMALGKPVVVSPMAAYPLVQDHVSGLIVNERKPHELSRAITQVLTSPEEASRLGSAARVAAQKYTWEKCGSILLKTYEELCSRK